MIDPEINSLTECDFMYSLDEATLPTTKISQAINEIREVFKYNPRHIVKANNEQTPIMCKLILIETKVSIKALTAAINPPTKK